MVKIGSNGGVSPTWESEGSGKGVKSISPEKLEQMRANSPKGSPGLGAKLIGKIVDNLRKEIAKMQQEITKMESKGMHKASMDTLDKANYGIAHAKLKIAELKENQYSDSTTLSNDEFKRQMNIWKNEIKGWKDHIKYIKKGLV